MQSSERLLAFPQDGLPLLRDLLLHRTESLGEALLRLRLQPGDPCKHRLRLALSELQHGCGVRLPFLQQPLALRLP